MSVVIAVFRRWILAYTWEGNARWPPRLRREKRVRSAQASASSVRSSFSGSPGSPSRQNSGSGEATHLSRYLFASYEFKQHPDQLFPVVGCVVDPDPLLLGFPYPDPFVRGTVRIRILLLSSKNSKKNHEIYCFVTSLWLFIFEKWCKCSWFYTNYISRIFYPNSLEDFSSHIWSISCLTGAITVKHEQHK